MDDNLKTIENSCYPTRDKTNKTIRGECKSARTSNKSSGPQVTFINDNFLQINTMDVFLMIRRKKTTIFLDAKENTKVSDLKRMIEGITKKPPPEQRLYNKDDVVIKSYN